MATRIIGFSFYDVFGNHAFWLDPKDWSAGVPNAGLDAVAGLVIQLGGDGALHSVPYDITLGAGQTGEARSLALLGQSFAVSGTLRLDSGLRLVPAQSPDGVEQAPELLVSGVLEVGGNIVNRALTSDPGYSLLAFNASGAVDAELRIDGSSVLSGGGFVSLNGFGASQSGLDGGYGVVFDAGAEGSTLVNRDNLIYGSGNLGGGDLKIVNGAAGTISASDMVIDTGANPFVNKGLTQGYLVFKSASLINSGDVALPIGSALVAAGPTLALSGDGQVRMQGGLITDWTGAETVINCNDTISGAGGIGGPYGMAFINRPNGVIDADDPTAALTIYPSAAKLASGTGPETQFTNKGLAEATAGGDLQLNFLGHVVNSGTLLASGGTVDIDGSNVDNAGGTIEADNGAIILTGASISRGALRIGAGGVLSEGPSGPDTIAPKSLENQGTIAAYYATSISAVGAITNGGTIEAVGFAATLDVYAPIHGGLLTDDGSASFVAHAKVTDATVELRGGGRFELGEASNVTVSFGATPFAQLWLDDWRGFSGVVENFGSGCAIDFRDVTAQVGDTAVWSPGAGGFGGTAEVMRGGVVIAKVAMAGSYSSNDFALFSDNDARLLLAFSH